MSSWELVKAGRYAEAVTAFSQEVAERPSQGALNNRGMAYLHLGDFAAALTDFEAAVRLHAEVAAQLTRKMPGCDRSLSGVALWMASRAEEAHEIWHSDVAARLAGESRYGDAAGGVTCGNLLWYAGVRLANQESLKLASNFLKKRLRTKQSAAWPGPAARFLLGSISLEEVLASVTSAPILRERQLCQAHFHFGVRALQQGDESKATLEMQAAYEFGSNSKLECEYYLSLHEARSS